MTLKLAIITASTRPGRKAPVVARWFTDLAREHARFDVQSVDLADYNLPLLDEASHPRLQQYEHEHTRKWSQTIGQADAFVFVTPEYDYFAPAALVNAIQVLLKEWAYKAAGIVSYGGVSAGLRSTQTVRQLLGNVGVMAIQQSVPIPFFSQFIDEEGVFRGNELSKEGAILMLDELFKWSSALKTIRE